MKSSTRSHNSGKSLIAQGEPMVWLSGGMFAIACAMIVALISLILYQGLSTLWPRPFVIYGLDDGTMVGGELVGESNFTLSQSGLSDLPEASRDKAKAILGKAEITKSKQLYLRTGNFDVGNRHFAYVPNITLSDPKPELPRDVWLVERLEWGVLFGFPVKYTNEYQPEMDHDFVSLQTLAQQIDRFRPTEEALAKTFDESVPILKELLDTEYARLTDEHRKGSDAIPAEVVDRKELDSIVSQSHRRVSLYSQQMEHAKEALGRLDRNLAKARLTVRKAELREKTDLLSTLDDGLQLAASLGTLRQQWTDLEESLAAWKRKAIASKSTEVTSLLNQLDASFAKEKTAELEPLVQAVEEWKTATTKELPARSKRSIDAAIIAAETTAAQQILLNAEIGRLEWVRGADQIVLQLPLLAGNALESAPESTKRGIATSELADRSMQYAWVPTEGTKPLELATKSIAVADMVRWFPPNNISWFGKVQIYFSRWFEFLFGEPREAGIEGGFFPAIFGTVVMTLLMSLAVMPFGVMAALYMREYAKSGWVLSLIRISINNLAGVPSIVYGVFGLAFFCYTIGGYVDGGPVKAGFTPWPPVTWFAACAGTVLAGTAAFFFAFLGSGSPAQMSASRKRIASFAGLFWVLCLIGFVLLLVKTPYFEGFYQASLPNPTFGKGCLLWASCTLALLTLPVVIVSTEEALSAVPNSLREGSYACGAGKWQTLQRIVLPYARPGIITGFILSMARGAGEVAPMMLVGAIPLATELPLDGEFPFFHGSRSFMHLGFQIFSLGFQSQNSEAAKPMVFTATLLLLTIVTLLNVAAIWLRARLRKRFQSSQF